MRPLTVDVGRIVLFKERNKSNEKAPDLRGACNIDGVQYEVSIWERESKRGVPYLSGVIKLARGQVANAERPADDEDIPFGPQPVDDGALRHNANETAARASRRW